MDIDAMLEDSRRQLAKWEKLAKRIKALSLQEVSELSDVLLRSSINSDWVVIPKDRLFEIMEKAGMKTELPKSFLEVNRLLDQD